MRYHTFPYTFPFYFSIMTETLIAAQKASGVKPYLRLTFSKAGESDVVVDQDQILHAAGLESGNSQKADILFQNSDGYFTDLDFTGWQVVIERGLLTTAGIEYDSLPAMKVISQDFVSAGGVLRCTMSFIGIPDLMRLDKASADYLNHSSNTKTVKSLFTEIADGQPVDTSLTEQQPNVDDTLQMLSGGDQTLVGVALTVPNRTITKLAFKLSKQGLPAGNVTFKITEATLNANGTVTVGNILASKTLATSQIDTSTTWREVTLDTPVVVNERVWLSVEYASGDGSNYIIVHINSHREKLNETLVVEEDASPDESWEDGSRTCAYRYTYTGGTGDTNGIDIFDHCTAYEVVYDSEDSLIDSYVPADGFKIYEGMTRLDVLNTLISFTGCVWNVWADNKIHVFVPTTTGTTYDYEYALGAGNHEFFAKSLRKALVIPNKVTVHSHSTDDTQYSGSATDATSYALLPKEHFVQATLTSDVQAASIAAAIIARLQMESQRGSANVPINLGAEIYDYVKVTDSWENDSRVGNIGHIRWSYSPGKEYRMSFSFGRYISAPIGGPTSQIPDRPPPKESPLTIEELADFQYIQNAEVKNALVDLYTKLSSVQDADSVPDQATDTGYLKNIIEDITPELGGNLKTRGKNIVFPTTTISDVLDEDTMSSNSATKLATQQSIKAYADTKLANVVEDTTPQLGGDLDLNGKNIDFPTTPNISDCLDEDDMASDSATKLATQQSIKAYINAHLGLKDMPAINTTAMTIDTPYTNSTGYPLLVVASVQFPASGGGASYLAVGPETPNTTICESFVDNNGIGVLVGIAPIGYTYGVYNNTMRYSARYTMQ